jgi:hypothetical protein
MEPHSRKEKHNMADNVSQVQRADRPMAAPGPLFVSKANPRYFAVRGEEGTDAKLVFLTGAHTT